MDLQPMSEEKASGVFAGVDLAKDSDQTVYRCERCGQIWTVHPFSLVPCPVCFAKVGQKCRRPSGHAGPFVEYHVAREQAALDAGVLQKCPGEKLHQEVRDFQQSNRDSQLSLF